MKTIRQKSRMDLQKIKKREGTENTTWKITTLQRMAEIEGEKKKRKEKETIQMQSNQKAINKMILVSPHISIVTLCKCIEFTN